MTRVKHEKATLARSNRKTVGCSGEDELMTKVERRRTLARLWGKFFPFAFGLGKKEEEEEEEEKRRRRRRKEESAKHASNPQAIHLLLAALTTSTGGLGGISSLAGRRFQ